MGIILGICVGFGIFVALISFNTVSLPRRLTFDEIISLAQAKMSAVKEINISYDYTFQKIERGNVTLSKKCAFIYLNGESNLNCTGIPEIYTLSPQRIFNLVKKTEGEYIGRIYIKNRYAWMTRSFFFEEDLKNYELNISNPTLIAFILYLDEKTGYPVSYQILIRNTTTTLSSSFVLNNLTFS